MNRTYDVMYKHYILTSKEIQTKLTIEKSNHSNGNNKKETLIKSDNIIDELPKNVHVQQQQYRQNNKAATTAAITAMAKATIK